MTLLRREFDGPLVVIRGERGWITDPARFTIGSTPGGERIEFVLPEARTRALGSLSAQVELPDGPRRLQLGEDVWEVLVAVPEHRSLDVAGEVFGFRFDATPAPLAKVAWMTRIFVGSSAALPFAGELEAAAGRAPVEPWLPDTLTPHLAERFQAAFPECDFEVAETLSVRFSTPEGMSGTLDFHSLWEQVANEPARLETSLADRFGSFRETRTPATPTRERILVSLKRTADVEGHRELLAETNDELMAERLAGDVWSLYVLDQPLSMEPLRASVARSLGLSLRDLAALAAENLWRSHDAFRVHGIPGRTHLMITCGGNYEASLVTVPQIWESIESVLGGECVVAVPSRDLLLVARADQREVIERIHALARRTCEEGAYTISDELLMRRDGEWYLYGP